MGVSASFQHDAVLAAGATFRKSKVVDPNTGHGIGQKR